ARGASGARRGARAAGSWGGARAAGSWVGARTAGSWVGARAAGSGLGARATRSWRGSRPASPRRSTGATASRGAATRGFAVFERLEVVLVTLAPAVRERHALAFAGAEGEARKRRLTRAHDDGQRANGIAAARRARAAVVRATAARRGSSRSGVGAAAAGSRLAGGARASAGLSGASGRCRSRPVAARRREEVAVVPRSAAHGREDDRTHEDSIA